MHIIQCGIITINDVDKPIYIDEDTRELLFDSADGLHYISNVIMPDKPEIVDEDNPEIPSIREVELLKSAYHLDGLAIVNNVTVSISLKDNQVSVGDSMLIPKYTTAFVCDTMFEGDITDVQV